MNRSMSPAGQAASWGCGGEIAFGRWNAQNFRASTKSILPRALAALPRRGSAHPSRPTSRAFRSPRREASPWEAFRAIHNGPLRSAGCDRGVRFDHGSRLAPFAESFPGVEDKVPLGFLRVPRMALVAVAPRGSDGICFSKKSAPSFVGCCSRGLGAAKASRTAGRRSGKSLCSARQSPQWDPPARSDQLDAACPWGNPPSEARVEELWRTLLLIVSYHINPARNTSTRSKMTNLEVECVGCAGTCRKPVGSGTIRRIIRAHGKALTKCWRKATATSRCSKACRTARNDPDAFRVRPFNRCRGHRNLVGRGGWPQRVGLGSRLHEESLPIDRRLRSSCGKTDAQSDSKAIWRRCHRPGQLVRAQG